MDSRVNWGDDYITVLPTPDVSEPFELGINSEYGFAAYFNHGNLFVKKFEPVDGDNYPDGDVSYETYTSNFMLELETLGELKKVKSDETVVHRERREIILNVPKHGADADIAAAVS